MCLAALLSACRQTVRLYEGPERPPGELVYVSLMNGPMHGLPIRVSGIDETAAPAMDWLARLIPYAAIEPGAHRVALDSSSRGRITQPVGPVQYDIVPITLERTFVAGEVYDWYRASSPDEDDVEYLWLAPSTAPAEHDGFGWRWDRASDFFSRVSVETTRHLDPTRAQAADWLIDDVILELRDTRPAAGGPR